MEERPIKALKTAPTSQNQKKTREIAQNVKSCLKGKKLLEIREVAKKFPSNCGKPHVHYPDSIRQSRSTR